MFTRLSLTDNDYSRVITYINIKFIKLHFSLRKDIFNYRNINLISFFNCNFIINIYSDNQQTTLKYLKDTEVNLNNVLIITDNFNIRDNNWNLSYPHHLTYTDILQEIANSFNSELSLSTNQILTCYADNP